MNKLEVSQMENVNGGDCWRVSEVGCAGLGFVFGLANGVVGFLVGLGCSHYYSSIESYNPCVFGE
jgi:hypothetical protein